VIFLDPGHGGDDAGATEGPFQEAAYCLALAQDLGKRLVQDGYAVRYSRDSAAGLSLGARVALANAAHPDAVLSLHVNRSFQKGATGPRLFVPSEGPVDEPAAPLWEQVGRVHARESKALALALAKALGVRGGRPVQTLTMALFRGLQPPACVLELGFANDPSDLKALQDPGPRQQMLGRLAQGLEAFVAESRGSHAP
jgi:N-acetylmuramoyl-L-alanine amidase